MDGSGPYELLSGNLTDYAFLGEARSVSNQTNFRTMVDGFAQGDHATHETIVESYSSSISLATAVLWSRWQGSATEAERAEVGVRLISLALHERWRKRVESSAGAAQ